MFLLFVTLGAVCAPDSPIPVRQLRKARLVNPVVPDSGTKIAATI